MSSAPGRHYRKGISLIELAEMFPDESSAERWFEEVRWPNPEDRECPFTERNFRLLHDRPVAHREELAAIAATIR